MTSKRSAFGPTAQRAAECFQAHVPVIFFDAQGLAEALRDALRRKALGERFFARFVSPREHTMLVDAIAPQIMGRYASYDERRVAFDEASSGALQVDGRALRDLRIYNETTLRLVRAVIRLSDGLAVTGETERRRVSETFRVNPEYRLVRGEDGAVPIPGSHGARRPMPDTILIWGPHLSGAAAAGAALPLLERHAPMTIISAGPSLVLPGVEWLSPERAAEGLRRAKLIVDLTAYGPEASLRLAQWGVPLVADSESGAHELLTDVHLFDRRQSTPILEAVSAALTAQPPAARQAAIAPSLIEPGPPKFLTDGPLVSLVIPTYNRPQMLRNALESVQRQWYSNIEAVVVNDGGEPLDKIVNGYSRARLVTMTANNPPRSINEGFRTAKGTYVGLLCDDDVLFPDHVAALVTALERSGETVVHADVLTAFLRGGDAEWTLYGLDSLMSRFVELGALLVNNQIGTNSVLFRRDAFPEGADTVDESVPFSRDYALWVKLASAFDFVHVERLTSIYTIRNQGSEQISTMWSEKTLSAFQAIYSKFPVHDRAVLASRREATLLQISRGQQGLVTQPAAELRPMPWPLWRSDNET
jgi:hypothetical protein